MSINHQDFSKMDKNHSKRRRHRPSSIRLDEAELVAVFVFVVTIMARRKLKVSRYARILSKFYHLKFEMLRQLTEIAPWICSIAIIVILYICEVSKDMYVCMYCVCYPCSTEHKIILSDERRTRKLKRKPTKSIYTSEGVRLTSCGSIICSSHSRRPFRDIIVRHDPI